jgi:hypothetical protein
MKEATSSAEILRIGLEENAHAELVFILPVHNLTLTKWAP